MGGTHFGRGGYKGGGCLRITVTPEFTGFLYLPTQRRWSRPRPTLRSRYRAQGYRSDTIQPPASVIISPREVGPRKPCVRHRTGEDAWVETPPIHSPPPTLAHKLPRGIRHHALVVSCPEHPDRATYRLNREIRGFASEGRCNIHEIFWSLGFG